MEFFSLNNESHKFIDQYLTDMWQKVLNNKPQFAFFNSTNNNNFLNYIDDYLEQIDESYLIFRDQIKQNQYKQPYYPFLKFVKKFIDKNNIDVEQYLAKTEVYSLHKSIFECFLRGQQTKRQEEILLEELDYEKRRIYQGIFSLLRQLTDDQPLVLVLEDLHNAKQSTLELIKHLIKNDYTGQIMFIFSFQRQIQSNNDGFEERKWTDFISIVEDYYTIIDYDEQEINNDTATTSYSSQSKLKVKELIELARDSFHLLALSEAKEYLIEAYNRQQEQEIELSPESHIGLLNLLGDVHNYLNENKEALNYYSLLDKYVMKNNIKADLATAYRKKGVIYFKKNNLESAYRLAKQSLKLALDGTDKQKIFDAYFLIYRIQEGLKEYSTEQWEQLYKKIISLGKELNLDNTLARCYISFYDRRINYDIKYYKQGLSIAKDYNNEYRIAVAYHYRAILYKRENNYDKTLEYYTKSEQLKKKINNRSTLPLIYNGLGHYYFLVEDYEQAYEYYNQSLHYLREIKDYHEIAVTCFNIASVLFSSFEHEQALFYFNKVVDILQDFQMNELMYHTKTEIYSLLGINYIKTGKVNKANEYIIKIQSEGEEIEGVSFENLFLELFMALLFKEDDDYQAMKLHFDTALTLLDKIEDTTTPLYPRFYYEYGLGCKQFGRIDEAEKWFKKGLEIAKESNYDFYQNKILKELDTAVDIDGFDFAASNFEFSWIKEAAELEKALNQVEKRIAERDFLNKLQNILVENSDKEVLIKKVMDLIDKNFVVQESYFYLKEKGSWQNHFKKSNQDFPEFEIVEVISDLLQQGQERLIVAGQDVEQLEELMHHFNSVIFIPFKNNKQEMIGFMLCGTANNQFLLTNDDFNVLSIAAKQIVMALERIKRDKLNLYNQMQVKFQKEMIHAMINMLEIHDEYTKGHSENVAQLAVQVAYELGLDLSDINDAYWAGKIHDIGKTLVPTKILNKKGKLTDKEYQKIKNHPTWGYQALQDLEQLDKIANYIYYHHERCDGKGYPNGVGQEEIPLISRVLTVVDAWDAMRSKRSYRDPLPQEEAIKELKENKGTQFSPQVVDAFLNII